MSVERQSNNPICIFSLLTPQYPIYKLNVSLDPCKSESFQTLQVDMNTEALVAFTAEC